MPDGAPDMTAWDRVSLARHQQRPRTLDFIAVLCDKFVELHGDRQYRDDHALVGGLATFRDTSLMVIGHQKGRDTKENLERNFGMVRPEGYRKALRLMRHAGKFGLPVLTFVDTPGADPGPTSEEHGQAFAIAECIQALTELDVPVVSVVIGEGGSGGALAIGVGDRIIMLENAIYSVASPEASASILWKDANQASSAAAAMRITAHELLDFQIVDDVVAEDAPAHEDAQGVITRTGDAVETHLAELIQLAGQSRDGTSALLDARHRKYRTIGHWQETLVSNGGTGQVLNPDSQIEHP